MIAWIAIAALAIAGIVLALQHDAGTVLGLENYDFARLVALSALGLVIGSGLIWSFRGNLPKAAKMAAVWLLIAGILVVGYTFRYDAQAVFARVAGAVVPGIVMDPGDGTVSVVRAGNGHFVLETRVNGASVPMLFDTGASTVALTFEDAAAAGIEVQTLDYRAPIWTANGRTTAAPVILETIEVGSIQVARVRAVVARPGTLRESLLGMSFLDRISTWRVDRDRLILGG